MKLLAACWNFTTGITDKTHTHKLIQENLEELFARSVSCTSIRFTRYTPAPVDSSRSQLPDPSDLSHNLHTHTVESVSAALTDVVIVIELQAMSARQDVSCADARDGSESGSVRSSGTPSSLTEGPAQAETDSN